MLKPQSTPINAGTATVSAFQIARANTIANTSCRNVTLILLSSRVSHGVSRTQPDETLPSG